MTEFSGLFGKTTSPTQPVSGEFSGLFKPQAAPKPDLATVTMEQSTSPYKLSGPTTISQAPPTVWPLGPFGRVAKAAFDITKGSIEGVVNKIGNLFDASDSSNINLKDYEKAPGFSKYNADGTPNPNYEKEVKAREDFFAAAPKETALTRGIKAGETGLSFVNLYPPIAQFNAELAAAKQLPGPLSLPAKAIDAGFQKLSGLGAKAIGSGIDELKKQGVITQKTADTIKPFSQEVSSFVTLVVGTHLGFKAMEKGLGTSLNSLPLSERAKTNINTGVQLAVGFSMQPFSTAYGLVSGMVATKIQERSARGIEITEAETRKIMDEVQRELPAKIEAQKATETAPQGEFQGVLTEKKGQQPAVEAPVEPKTAPVEAQKALTPLETEARKFKTAQEFVDAYSKDPSKIPVSEEYKTYLAKQEKLVQQEKDYYQKLKDLREKYDGKTMEDVTAKDKAEYDRLQSELNNTLSEKTQAKSPETEVKIHIGDKELKSQLTAVWERAQKPLIAEPKAPESRSVEPSVRTLEAEARKYKSSEDFAAGSGGYDGFSRSKNEFATRAREASDKYLEAFKLGKDVKQAKAEALRASEASRKEYKRVHDLFKQASAYFRANPEASPKTWNDFFKESTAKTSNETKTVQTKKVETKAEPKAETPHSKMASRVFERMKAENPKIEGDLNYNEKNLKEDAQKAVELVATDKQKAYDIAMGKEVSAEVLQTSANIALFEKAIDEGNYKLASDLVRKRSLDQSRRGQEISAERGSVNDNSTAKYVKELIASRLDKLGKDYLSDVKEKLTRTTDKGKAAKIIDKEVAKVEAQIKAKKLDMKSALTLLDKLTCL